jgi:hypothetical protein
VEEQDKESSGEDMAGGCRPGRHFNQGTAGGTVRSVLDSQAREIVKHRKRMVEKHFKGSSSSSGDSEAAEHQDHASKVQPQGRGGSPNRLKKNAFGSALDNEEPIQTTFKLPPEP